MNKINKRNLAKNIVDISFKFNDDGSPIAADHAYNLFQVV